ncbi:MAG TPA: YlxR family protein [Actinomycetota bacterium]|nr:YlxR family protein [Actinomycetota bacterium]
MGQGRPPERTCVGCRGRAAKAELLRVVRTPDGRVAVDPSGRLPGRGAYVHRREACVERAGRRGALARALRTSLPPEQAGSLMEELRALMGADRP